MANAEDESFVKFAGLKGLDGSDADQGLQHPLFLVESLDLLESLPGEIRGLVGRLLEVDPERRPTLGEVIEEFGISSLDL
jgi:hypothetical protein